MKDIRKYSAIAAVIVAFIFVPIVVGNITQTKAMDMIEDSINETDEIKTMVITYSMKNPFTYNPDVIEMNSKMNEMTAKIIFEQPAIWRFASKNKWYFFDGKKTYWYSNAYNYCLVRNNISEGDLGRFNTLFLKPTMLLEKIHKMAENKNAKIEIQTKEDSTILTINHKLRSIDKNRFMTGDIFGWYENNLKSSFTTNCRQIYVFNKNTKLLLGFNISVLYKNKFISILKSKNIKYNTLIDKENIVEIPKNIKKQVSKTFLRDMPAKQVISMILNDLKNDSTSTLNERSLFYGIDLKLDYKNYYGLEILKIGEPYKKDDYTGECVPVQIRLSNGVINNTDIKIYKPKNKTYWVVGGGL